MHHYRMIYPVIAIIFLCSHFVFGDNCCPGCDESCPWNNACSNGQNEDCKDRIAGPFRCHDRENSCRNFDDCDDREAAKRAGYLCDRFPYYNGGFPLEKLRWDSESKEFTCTNSSNNNRYCKVWKNFEDSVDEFEVGLFTCTSPSSNNNYCQSWSSSQTEYKKCFNTIVYGEQGPSITAVCCDGKNAAFYPCCTTLCPISTYNIRVPQYEYSDCECTEPSANGLYCSKWHCEEYQYPSQTFETGREFEDYMCMSSGAALNDGGLTNNNVSDGIYCSKWNGSTDAREEFELTQCQCVDLTTDSLTGLSFCSRWTCVDRGMDYYWPNSLWILLPAILGGVPYALLLYNYYVYVKWGETSQTTLPLWWTIGIILVFTIWLCSLSMIAIVKAGLISLFFVTLPLFVVTIFVLIGGNMAIYCSVDHTNTGNARNAVETVDTSEIEFSVSPRRENGAYGNVHQNDLYDPAAINDMEYNEHHSIRKGSDVKGGKQYVPLSTAAATATATTATVTATAIVSIMLDDSVVDAEAAVVASGDSGPMDMRGELRKWKDLFNEGLISQDIYDAGVLRIVEKYNR